MTLAESMWDVLREGALLGRPASVCSVVPSLGESSKVAVSSTPHERDLQRESRITTVCFFVSVFTTPGLGDSCFTATRAMLSPC